MTIPLPVNLHWEDPGANTWERPIGHRQGGSWDVFEWMWHTPEGKIGTAQAIWESPVSADSYVQNGSAWWWILWQGFLLVRTGHVWLYPDHRWPPGMDGALQSYRKPLTSEGLAEVIINAVIRRHGLSDSIVSDWGFFFTSQFWFLLCHCYFMSKRRRLSTAFHSQTNGQTEHQYSTTEAYLRSYVSFNKMIGFSVFPWPNLLSTSKTWLSSSPLLDWTFISTFQDPPPWSMVITLRETSHSICERLLC